MTNRPTIPSASQLRARPTAVDTAMDMVALRAAVAKGSAAMQEVRESLSATPAKHARPTLSVASRTDAKDEAVPNGSRNTAPAQPTKATGETIPPSSGEGVTGVTGVTPTVSGAMILNEVTSFLRDYIAYPTTDVPYVHALWIAHTWLCGNMDTTPRLCFVSPEKRSGKTRAQECTALLSANPVRVVSVTASYLFRRISEQPDGMLPTIILDETDALFGNRSSEATEEIRGILNEGYRVGGHVGRTEKTAAGVFETRDYPVFAPVCLAGIGKLPDTISDRAIMVHMKRRRPDQMLKPYRDRSARKRAEPIRRKLEEWAKLKRAELAEYSDADYPTMPTAIQDRDADNWEPLFIIAKLAGGKWPHLVERIAPAMVKAQHAEPQSLGVLLLHDIRKVFDAEHADRMFRLPMLGKLKELDGAPWATLGKSDEGIDSNYLTRVLKSFDVPLAHTIVIDGVHQWGWNRSDFEDAWTRYLPAEVTPETVGVTPVTPVTPSPDEDSEPDF